MLSLWTRRSLWALMLLLMTAFSASLGRSPAPTPLAPVNSWPTHIAILSLSTLGLLTLLLQRRRTP